MSSAKAESVYWYIRITNHGHNYHDYYYHVKTSRVVRQHIATAKAPVYHRVPVLRGSAVLWLVRPRVPRDSVLYPKAFLSPALLLRTKV